MLHPEDGILYAYLDGECTDNERAEIEAHLQSCSDCGVRLEAARGIGLESASLLGELEPGSIQMPPWHELEQIAAERRGAAKSREDEEPGEPTAPFWRMKALAWAASLVVAFGLGWLVSTDLPGTAPESGRVSMQDLRAQSETPALPAKPPDATAELSELRDDEVRANSPAAEPGREQAQTDRDAEGLAVTDEISQPAAGEGKVVERVVGPEEAEPLPTVVAQGQSPAAPPADPAMVVGAVSEDEAAARQRRADIPEAGMAQAFAARKKPDAAETRAEKVVPAAAAAPEARQRSVAAETEAEGVLEENVAAGAGGYRAFLDNFAAPPAGDDSRPVSAVGFVSVSPESAETWLGAPLRTLPDLTLLRVEVGPGSVVEGAIAGRPLVALFYEDAAGQGVTLIQQHSPGLAGGSAAVRRSEAGPATFVTPAGLLALRWLDLDYHLTLIGGLSSDSLRSLADRVR